MPSAIARFLHESGVELHEVKREIKLDPHTLEPLVDSVEMKFVVPKPKKTRKSTNEEEEQYFERAEGINTDLARLVKTRLARVRVSDLTRDEIGAPLHFELKGRGQDLYQIAGLFAKHKRGGAVERSHPLFLPER